MGDDDLQNHPNWNAILQWSLKFQDEPSENRVLEPLDQEVVTCTTIVVIIFIIVVARQSFLELHCDFAKYLKIIPVTT